MDQQLKKQIWKKLPPVAPDPIFVIFGKCQKDPRPEKVNLTVGIYKDEQLQPYVIQPIKQLIAELIANDDTSFFDELPEFHWTKTADLLIAEFFDDHNAHYQKAKTDNRVVVVPCQSGGNGLYNGFELYKHQHGGPVHNSATHPPLVWTSNPSWPIHNQMIAYHKLDSRSYRYYNPKTNKLDFEGMVEDLSQMRKGDMFLVQSCGHNPTGFDPSYDQWRILADLCLEKQVLVFFDFAYMGFASGDIAKDSFSVNLFLERGIEMYITFSCAKNFGLYSCRVGFFMTISKDHSHTTDTLLFLERATKQLYGLPTSFGQMVVGSILSDHKKREYWYEAFRIMFNRLFQMRTELKNELRNLGSLLDWTFLTEQSGMFAYTGLSEGEIEELQEKFAVFMLKSGRISIAGLNHQNVGLVAKAFHEVTKNRPLAQH